jgi:hypothetical protein
LERWITFFLAGQFSDSRFEHSKYSVYKMSPSLIGILWGFGYSPRFLHLNSRQT